MLQTNFPEWLELFALPMDHKAVFYIVYTTEDSHMAAQLSIVNEDRIGNCLLANQNYRHNADVGKGRVVVFVERFRTIVLLSDCKTSKHNLREYCKLQWTPTRKMRTPIESVRKFDACI